MLKRKPGNNKAQSVLEYALAIVCVVAALLAMQNYIRRGIQGKLRQSADELGQLYAPANTTGNFSLSDRRFSTIKVETKSEKELGNGYAEEQGPDEQGVDLNENGYIEHDVFGTTTLYTIDDAVREKNGSEIVKIWK